MIRLCSVFVVGLLLVGGIGGMEVVDFIYHPCGDTPVFCFGKPYRCDGFINSHGEILHRFQAAHRISGPFNEGLLAAESPDSERWGYLDTRGNWAIQPSFGDADPFKDGTARVRDAKTGLWGFIDRAGDYVIAPGFNRLTDFSDDGLAAFQPGPRYGGDRRFGVLNRAGEVVIEPKFLIIGPFSDGFAQAVLDEGACLLVHRDGSFMMLGDSDASTAPPVDCRRVVVDAEGKPHADIDPATMASLRSSWSSFPNLANLAPYRLDPTYSAAGRSCHGLDQIHRAARDGMNEAAFVDQAGKTVFAWKWRW